MTVSDGLFSFPQLTFIYVHDIIVVQTSLVEYTADRNGITIPADAEQIPLKGYAATPNVHTIGQFSDQVDAIVRIPHSSITVDLQDMIIIPPQQQGSVLAALVGTYLISDQGIRPNPLDQRIFIKRPKTGTPNRDNPVT